MQIRIQNTGNTGKNNLLCCWKVRIAGAAPEVLLLDGLDQLVSQVFIYKKRNTKKIKETFGGLVCVGLSSAYVVPPTSLT
jgi:hypothetical protein